MMKLRFTPNPDYIHKVLVAAAEAGITDRLDYVRTGPFDADTDLWRDNPLNKVPTLVLEDGEALYGGAVICEYFDSLHDGPKMFPTTGRRRFTALRQMMLGEGVFEAAVALDLESWREAHERRADRHQPEPLPDRGGHHPRGAGDRRLGHDDLVLVARQHGHGDLLLGAIEVGVVVRGDLDPPLVDEEGGYLFEGLAPGYEYRLRVDGLAPDVEVACGGSS